MGLQDSWGFIRVCTYDVELLQADEVAHGETVALGNYGKAALNMTQRFVEYSCLSSWFYYYPGGSAALMRGERRERPEHRNGTCTG